ncbi:hypothetical protein D3C78_1805040 [compost metagenome]
MKRLQLPRPAMLVRSWPSRYLAMAHPLCSSPTKFSRGTQALSKNTSLTSYPPSRVLIGRTSMPGLLMSISRKEIPSC